MQSYSESNLSKKEKKTKKIDRLTFDFFFRRLIERQSERDDRGQLQDDEGDVLRENQTKKLSKICPSRSMIVQRK
jgi:hypothetical protein